MLTLRSQKTLLWGILALLIAALAPLPAQASDYGAKDLTLGSRGTVVAQLQTDLKELGFYAYSMDGIFAQKTLDAVKDFQESRGLKTDGVVGAITKAALNDALAQAGSGAAGLIPGSRGTAVAQLQTDLKELGFYAYSVDGIFAQKTLDAVKDFQKSRGLKTDGVVGPITRNALNDALIKAADSNSALSPGSRGTAVAQLQEDLKELGFYAYSVDGSFAQKTLDAVKDFQKARGLKVDGVVGPITRAALDEVLQGDGLPLAAPTAAFPTEASISRYNSHEKPIVDAFRASFDGSPAQALVGRAIWYMEYGFMKYGHTKYATTGYIDCSNFVALVYKDFGYSITSAARNYGSVGVKVEGVYGERIPGSTKYTLKGVDKLKPGDIFTFWNSDEPVRTRIGHVALYMGVINGKPCIINTCSGNPTAVGVIDSFSYWYGSDLIEVRRILPDSAFTPGNRVTDSGPVIPAIYQIKPDKPIVLPKNLETGF